MLCGVFAGQTLKMLIHMSQAKRVLEIGMFTGYGALSMAEGLPEDGYLIACELEPYLKEFAQPIFDKSPHGKKIIVKTGSALDTLKVRGKKTNNWIAVREDLNTCTNPLEDEVDCFVK